MTLARAFASACAIACAFSGADALAATSHDAADHGKKEAPVRERSIGSPTDGHLIGGTRVSETPYERVFPQYAGEDVRYGLSELVGAIDRAAKEVHRKFPDAVLSVGHLSRRGGGEIDRHASHESGRDADVGFYVRNDAGKGVLADHMVQFKGDGTAASWPGAHFDDARNWTFVSTLLSDPRVHISYIFIAAPLRARLLAYAEKIGAPSSVREHAAQVVMQPHGALPHDDHFHIRISCPSGMTQCVEFPTRPKHARLVPPLRSRGATGTAVVASRSSHGASTSNAAAAHPHPAHVKPSTLPTIDPTPEPEATTPSTENDATPSFEPPAAILRSAPDADDPPANQADPPIEDADGPLDDVR